MRIIGVTVGLILYALAGAAVRAEAPTIHLEVAVESSAGFDAQQRWYSVLKDLGVASLRLREAQSGEEPAIKPGGSDRAPRYQVTAVVNSRNELVLPGGRFGERDRGGLAGYLRQLQEEGIDGVTASRGMFGLTEKQFEAVHEELAEPVGKSTAARRPREIVDEIADGLRHRLIVDGALVARLDRAEAFASELRELSRGTALAILLRQAGLEFRPQMRSGELLYEVAEAQPRERDARRQRQREAPNAWPIGWEPTENPGKTVPALFEIISAEIDGYTLAEALEAILPRVDVLVVIDRYGLESKQLKMSETHVKLPAGRYSYDRILGRILFQGGLNGTIRVDERGTPFYWIAAL